MTDKNITAEDLNALRINDRKPRAFRNPLNAEEATALLATEIDVTNLATLQAARNQLTLNICDLLGVTRRQVKLPQAHLVLISSTGQRLTRWEGEMRERVKSANDATFRIAISPDVQRGVLQAWEAKR